MSGKIKRFASGRGEIVVVPVVVEVVAIDVYVTVAVELAEHEIPKLSALLRDIIHSTALRMLSGLNIIWDFKIRQYLAPSIFILKIKEETLI